MNILGLKLSHDATIAYAKDGVLQFSIELEKLDDRPRHAHISSIADLHRLERAAIDQGVQPEEIDLVAIDGWHNSRISSLGLNVAPYCSPQFPLDAAAAGTTPLMFFGRYCPVVSRPHITNHITGTYLMSPYASTGEDVGVLVWDGGCAASYWRISRSRLVFVKTVTPLSGFAYGLMGLYWGPYKVNNPGTAPLQEAFRALPGKLMAWIGHGTCNVVLLEQLHALYDASFATRLSEITNPTIPSSARGTIDREFFDRALPLTHGLEGHDVLATLHDFFLNILVEGMGRDHPQHMPLLFTGGSALNIKWNSALRTLFGEVWVSPCTNDSGSAIGAIASELYLKGASLQWDVYAGPRIIPPRQRVPGWEVGVCSLNTLADLLVAGHPALLLTDQAEIGPRALGHRSLLLAPQVADGKALLNRLKDREDWRPVAPIVLQEDAPAIFDPGTPDPYMLFDHAMRPEYQDRFPALHHLDHTARIQTVSMATNPTLYMLLLYVKDRTGVGMLCNTSANYKGCGFFPSVQSAMEWGRVPFIWSQGALYSNPMVKR